MTQWRKYLLWFAQEHIDFRYTEIQSILKLYNIPFKSLDVGNLKQPFFTIELNDEISAKKLASRSVSLRCILELWAHSKTIPNFHTTLNNYINENSINLAKNFDANKSFKITVETYNKHFRQSDKIKKIETLNYIPVMGDCNLKSPDIEWWYIEYYGLDTVVAPEQPFDIMFGKWLADGRRSLLKELSLKQRKFIGNTSMDPQLSLLMANQALVKQNDLVYDPFVGSGSLLVAAAKFGAYVMGTDIDFLMLHGRTRSTRIQQKVRANDECVRVNLKQYNCEHLYLDILVSDFSKSMWNNSIVFDSIITDPPYGIREATEKVEKKIRIRNKFKNITLENNGINNNHYNNNTNNTHNNNNNNNNNNRNDNVDNNEIAPPYHIPSTSHYNLSQLYSDLLNFSAKYLKLGGRLVCWLPIIKTDYNEDMIPKHSCLQLVGNAEQDLSGLTSRRLLTYEKINNFKNFESQNITVPYNFMVGDFREKFFSYGEDTRQERRIRKAELKEIGRQEAIKRGKILDKDNPQNDIVK